MPTAEIVKILSVMDAIESRRSEIGDEATETALSALREKLQRLEDRSVSRGRKLRKQVTVLFADISGFTAISESSDPEELTEALNTLWTKLDPVLTRNGGVVDKHMGDAVMALWGMDYARETDQERAVRAALELQEVLSSTRLEEGDAQVFSMRVGVHTGPVYLAPVGTAGEYTAMGDTVNTANRVQASAPPGTVAITHEMYRHVSGLFAMTPREPVQVKGKTQPLRTYIVSGAKPKSFVQLNRGITGMETEMVGRGSELNRLVGSFRTAIEEKRTIPVTIIGDAGVGKSRLLFELRRSIAGEAGSIPVFAGRCAPETEGVPCSVFRDVLRLRFDIHEDDPVSTLASKIEQGMAGVLDRDESLLAGHFAGFGLSSTEPVARLEGSSSLASLGRSYLLRFLRKTAEKQGAVLFLEDMHWADPLSLDLARELMTRDGGRPLLIVALARPALLERDPWWGDPEGICIRLEPLSRSDCRTLTGKLLSLVTAGTEDVLGLVAESAEGNPFYVEELIKMLIDDGIIVRGEDCWTVRPGGLGTVSIPSTLTGVLQARLDSLPEEEREVLQMASVVGRLFWDLTVKRISSAGSRPDSMEALESVRSRELVYRSGSSAFSSAREYIFKHAILRDVTYGTVLLRLRKAYHRLVAEWLEVNCGERFSEFAGLIAEHYERAGDSERAPVWLGRAGRAAYSTSAFREALSYFNRALEMLDGTGMSVRADLLYRRGSCQEKLCMYDDASESLENAVEAAIATGSEVTEAEALITLTWIATVRGRYEEARELGHKAMDAAERSGDRSVKARAIMRMADYEEDYSSKSLLSYFQRSLGIYRELGDRGGIAIALLNMGNICMDFGLLQEAKGHYEESLEMYQALHNRWGEANCLGNLGNVERALGNPLEALDLRDRSLAISTGIGDLEGEVLCNLNMGLDLRDQGDMEGYLEHTLNAMDKALSLGLLPLAAAAMTSTAEWMEISKQYHNSALILTMLQEHDELVHPGQLEEIREAVGRLSRNIGADAIENISASASGLSFEEAARRTRDLGGGFLRDDVSSGSD